MPLLILLLIVVLIAQFGFWDTLSAVLGATAMVILLVLLVLGLLFLSIRTWFMKFRRRL